jgi:hypothetical protein
MRRLCWALSPCAAKRHDIDTPVARWGHHHTDDLHVVAGEEPPAGLQRISAIGGATLEIAMTGRQNGYAKALLTPLISLTLSGCAQRGAPSFTLFGAFFPAWMFCALLGIFAAIGARMTFVVSGLSSILPFQLFVCASLGVCFALLAWLLWFGQ